jgi:predicted component of type VI protein secretion system
MGYQLMIRIKTTLFPRYTARAVIVLLFMTGILYGCGYIKSWMGGGSTVKKEYVTFQIMPVANSNDERPVYILIRKVNKMEFLTENYDRIASRVFASQPDENALAWQILFPGQYEKITIEMPDKTDIGVYALFANPGDNWKMILEKPLKTQYRINVKNNNLE